MKLHRVIVVIATLIATEAYLRLVALLVGRLQAQLWPKWWLDLAPSRHAAVITWLVMTHAAALLLAALPVAVVLTLSNRRKAIWFAATAGALAWAVDMTQGAVSGVLALEWSAHPVFFVTDAIELIGVMPLIVWLMHLAASNNRFERTRGAIAQGGAELKAWIKQLRLSNARAAQPQR